MVLMIAIVILVIPLCHMGWFKMTRTIMHKLNTELNVLFTIQYTTFVCSLQDGWNWIDWYFLLLELSEELYKTHKLWSTVVIISIFIDILYSYPPSVMLMLFW